MQPEGPYNRILVTSAVAAEGKTCVQCHTKDHDKMLSDWKTELAKEIKQRHPDWTKSDVCRQVAKEDGESEKWDSIRRTLNRLDPNWDKKVGHS